MHIFHSSTSVVSGEFFTDAYISVIMFGAILATNSQLIPSQIAIFGFAIGLIISGFLLFADLARKSKKK